MIDGGLFILFAAIFILLGYAPYVVHNIIYPLIFKTQDLKKKYGASWALVTGASSGIGKAFASKLADQGINVVLVGLPDQVLDDAEKDLKSKYPNCRFRKVGVNLGEQGGAYLRSIVDATVDIDVQLIFNIAGYIVTGMFYNSKLDAQMANMECNATSAVRVSHHFLQKMIDKKLPGCVVFASSPAGLVLTPFSVMYGCTKAFLQHFAISLAPEVKPHGIDVVAFFPSPTATRFYEQTSHKIDLLEWFRRMSKPPEKIPDEVFGALGRSVLIDLGFPATCFRLVNKLVDANFLAQFTSKIVHLLPDYKRNKDL